MSRQNRATPPQIKVSHLSPDPPVALSSHSQQAGGAAGWWRVSRHFWVPKTDRATGGIAATVTPVALLCATKLPGVLSFELAKRKRKMTNWAAANGGATNGDLRGVWPPLLEIGRNRPFSPFVCLCSSFPDGPKSTWETQKTEEKGLFLRISSDLLEPPSLKPPFAAL